MTKNQKLRKRYKLLHKYLDELAAAYVAQTKGFLTETTVMELVQWTHEQSKKPSQRKGTYENVTNRDDNPEFDILHQRDGFPASP